MTGDVFYYLPGPAQFLGELKGGGRSLTDAQWNVWNERMRRCRIGKITLKRP